MGAVCLRAGSRFPPRHPAALRRADGAWRLAVPMADQAPGVEPVPLLSAWQGRRRLLQAARRELHLPHSVAGRV
eukprot:15468800-Alexandrium_andersonii.AAC.1